MNIYKSIPHLQGCLIQPGRNGIGQLGETLAALLLEKNGYQVTHTRIGQRRGDLQVIDTDGQIHRIEVKTARRSKDKKWRFLLYKQGEQDYRDADFVLLLAVTASGQTIPFLIPTAEIGQRSIICITSNPRQYTGRWAAFRRTESNLILGACRYE